MNRLKILREEKGLLQSDLANIIGVTQKAISNYESGTRDMSTKIQIQLANLFGVSIDYLVGNSNERNPNKINSNLLQLGLDLNDYNIDPTENQLKQIEEFAKLVLKDNKKEEK